MWVRSFHMQVSISHANATTRMQVRRSTLMAQGALLPLLHMLAASGQPSAGAQDLEAGATAAWALCSLTKGRGNAALGTFVCMDGVQAAFVGALTQLHSWELTSEVRAVFVLAVNGPMHLGLRNQSWGAPLMRLT